MKRYYDDTELFTTEVLSAIAEEHTAVLGDDFVKKCTACGGNWTRMFMTGMKVLFPKTWEAMPDRTYGFLDIIEVLLRLGVDFSEK